MRRVAAAGAAFWFASLFALASGGEPATTLQHHVDTSSLTSSDLLLATLYNEHRILYAAFTTASMAVLGLAIGFVLDAVLEHLGFRVSKAEHRE